MTFVDQTPYFGANVEAIGFVNEKNVPLRGTIDSQAGPNKWKIKWTNSKGSNTLSRHEFRLI